MGEWKRMEEIKPSEEMLELNRKLMELASYLPETVNARNRTSTLTVVTAHRINEGDEVAAVRKRLGWNKVMAGDYIVDFRQGTFALIRQELFEERFEVILNG